MTYMFEKTQGELNLKLGHQNEMGEKENVFFLSCVKVGVRIVCGT